MKIRLASVAAATITSLAASAAASPADATTAPPDTASASSTVGSSAAATTTITLHVARCGHCPVRLTQSLPGHATWQSASQRVVDRTVTFTVPTARTHGMTVSVAPRWQALNAVPLVAFRYANTTIGQHISNAVAQAKRRGSPCWAGTTARDVSMAIRVVKYPQRTISGQPGTAIRVWARTTRHATPPYLRTHKGTVATQEVVSCRV